MSNLISIHSLPPTRQDNSHLTQQDRELALNNDLHLEERPTMQLLTPSSMREMEDQVQTLTHQIEKLTALFLNQQEQLKQQQELCDFQNAQLKANDEKIKKLSESIEETHQQNKNFQLVTFNQQELLKDIAKQIGTSTVQVALTKADAALAQFSRKTTYSMLKQSAHNTLPDLFKLVCKAGIAKEIAFTTGKLISISVGKAGAKRVAKFIPFASCGVSIILATQHFIKNYKDPEKHKKSPWQQYGSGILELISGATSLIPRIGISLSIFIDSGICAQEIYPLMTQSYQSKKQLQLTHLPHDKQYKHAQEILGISDDTELTKEGVNNAFKKSIKFLHPDYKFDQESETIIISKLSEHTKRMIESRNIIYSKHHFEKPTAETDSIKIIYEYGWPLDTKDALNILGITQELGQVEQSDVDISFKSKIYALHQKNLEEDPLLITTADLITRLFMVSNNIIYMKQAWEVKDSKNIRVKNAYTLEFTMKEMRSLIGIKKNELYKDKLDKILESTKKSSTSSDHLHIFNDQKIAAIYLIYKKFNWEISDPSLTLV